MPFCHSESVSVEHDRMRWSSWILLGSLWRNLTFLIKTVFGIWLFPSFHSSSSKVAKKHKRKYFLKIDLFSTWFLALQNVFFYFRGQFLQNHILRWQVMIMVSSVFIPTTSSHTKNYGSLSLIWPLFVLENISKICTNNKNPNWIG